MKRLALSMVLTGLLLPAAVAATNMRCGQHLIRVGDTKVDVIHRCGEPYFRELISGSHERNVEQWYYIPSSTQFQRIVTFRGTRVVDIEIKTP